MGGTIRLMEGLQRMAPRAGDAAGLLLWLWWTVVARGLPMPGPLVGGLGFVMALLLTGSLLGYQFAQGTQAGAWLGWAGVATVAHGSLLASPGLLAGGLALWGLAVVRCGVLPRVPGLMLVGAGTGLFLMSALAVEFVHSGAGTVGTTWRVLTGLALVVVAAALADLDAHVHDRSSPVRLTL